MTDTREELVQHQQHIARLVLRIKELEAERDEYRQQADNLRADNLRQATRIATLTADLAKLTIYRDRWKDAAQKLLTGLGPDRRLVKTQCTPDGVLVVLGVTELYCRAIGGGLGVGVPHCMMVGIQGNGFGVPCVTAVWHFTEVKLSNDRHWQLSQTVPLDWCYGSEAKLLEAEVKR